MLRMFRLRRPALGTLLGGLALIVVISGVAVAAIPGGDGTVTACVSSTGGVRVIDAEAGETCRDRQTQVKLATTDATGKVANADNLDGKDSGGFASSNQSCSPGQVVTGIDSTGSIVCTGSDTGDGGTGDGGTTDLCDGVDQDGDGIDGEDDPGVGAQGPNGGTIQCIDGQLQEVGGSP